MKKKVIIIAAIVLVLAVLLVPVPRRLKDGGTVEYRALLYKVSDVHRLSTASATGYETGIIVELCGIEVFNNVAP